METQIKKFVKLCEDYRTFARKIGKTAGWEVIYEENISEKVKCYFSIEGGEHTAVEICNIQIQFHDMPTIEFQIKSFTIKNLKQIIKKYTEILKQLDLEYKNKDKAKIKKEKDNKVKALKRQLKELE